jgi:hypothetical protein
MRRLGYGLNVVVAGLALLNTGCQRGPDAPSTNPKLKVESAPKPERQVTRKKCGHILTNTGVWSPDGKWIVYDIRPDKMGDVFQGNAIEMVQVDTGEVRALYQAHHDAYCGVATFHPRDPQVIFILGPENPTPDWQYSACHRQGVMVHTDSSGVAVPLDARDLTPPFTPGALRGGSHVHIFSPDGQRVSYTYEDHVLAQHKDPAPDCDQNLRNVGISVPVGPVQVTKDHPRNHNGDYYSVLVTRTIANPIPGSDEIKKAFEEGWMGTNGYNRSDGSRQKYALAFQGNVVTTQGDTMAEVFLVDIPEDVTIPGNGPLAGTEFRAPYPPKGTAQRRLTHTAQRKHPGIQGPRHWLRSSPDGSRIAFLMKDDQGVVQIWTICPNGGEPKQVTRNALGITSAFTWSPDGEFIAHVMDTSVCVTEVRTGKTIRLTPRCADTSAPLPLACVFSPDARQIAYLRQVLTDGELYNQVFVCQSLTRSVQ